MDWLQVISMVGWLALMLGVFASYRLEWRKTVRFALIWVALFGAMWLAFVLVGGWRA